MKCKRGILCIVQFSETTNVIINSITNRCTYPLEPFLTFNHLTQPVFWFGISKQLFTENACCNIVFLLRFCSVTIAFVCVVRTLSPLNFLFVCFVTSLRPVWTLYEVRIHGNKQFCLVRRTVEVCCLSSSSVGCATLFLLSVLVGGLISFIETRPWGSAASAVGVMLTVEAAYAVWGQIWNPARYAVQTVVQFKTSVHFHGRSSRSSRRRPPRFHATPCNRCFRTVCHNNIY